MSRPDYVTCINRAFQAQLQRSWCGRSLLSEFAFQGLDHAAESALQRSRLVACPECVEAAFAALKPLEEFASVRKLPTFQAG